MSSPSYHKRAVRAMWCGKSRYSHLGGGHSIGRDARRTNAHGLAVRTAIAVARRQTCSAASWAARGSARRNPPRELGIARLGGRRRQVEAQGVGIVFSQEVGHLYESAAAFTQLQALKVFPDAGCKDPSLRLAVRLAIPGAGSKLEPA
jgi:hypothetical protein